MSKISSVLTFQHWHNPLAIQHSYRDINKFLNWEPKEDGFNKATSHMLRKFLQHPTNKWKKSSENKNILRGHKLKDRVRDAKNRFHYSSLNSGKENRIIFSPQRWQRFRTCSNSPPAWIPLILRHLTVHQGYPDGCRGCFCTAPGCDQIFR